MPAMRLALTAPMWGAAHGGREKDGIPQVMTLMDDYSLTRCEPTFLLPPFTFRSLRAMLCHSDDWEALLDMTKIKVCGAAVFCMKRPDTLAMQAEGVPPGLRDPASLIPTVVKSAFTRECNKDTRSIRSGILLPDVKKGKRKAKVSRYTSRRACMCCLLTSRPQAADDAGELDDEFADEDEEEDEAEEELKHDPKRLATLAKRGMKLDLKEGVNVAKGKKPAPAKGKAAGGAAGKGASKAKK